MFSLLRILQLNVTCAPIWILSNIFGASATYLESFSQHSRFPDFLEVIHVDKSLDTFDKFLPMFVFFRGLRINILGAVSLRLEFLLNILIFLHSCHLRTVSDAGASMSLLKNRPMLGLFHILGPDATFVVNIAFFPIIEYNGTRGRF